MNALELVRDERTEVSFLSESKTLILKLSGIVSKDHLRTLRSNVVGMFRALGVTNLIMNTLESEYQEFDFTDEDRKHFYKSAEENGIERLEIIYPHRNFLKEVKSQWKLFFNQNDINIKVSARSN